VKSIQSHQVQNHDVGLRCAATRCARINTPSRDDFNLLSFTHLTVCIKEKRQRFYVSCASLLQINTQATYELFLPVLVLLALLPERLWWSVT
jgi:hypothetical protein